MKPKAQRIALGNGIHTAEWLSSTRAGQALLEASRSSKQRPRCMCVQGGVEMYVGRRGTVFYLSRMPGTGFLHTPDCASVEDETILTGAKCYAAGVLIERADGGLVVAADLNRLERQAFPVTEVGIDGLLDLLVEESSLNRIVPQFAARTWLFVRDRLASAASLITLGAEPLPRLIYLPERYDRENSREALATCEAFIQGHTGTALICAPLKEIRSTQYGWQIVLKHLPGLRLWMSKETAAALEARWTVPWLHQPPKFGLCLIAVRPGRRDGNYSVSNMACLPTDATFFPAFSPTEAAAAAELCAAGKTVVRPLRFDLAPEEALADFAILDEDGVRPVVVLSEIGNPAYDAAKKSLGAMLQRNGAGTVIAPRQTSGG